MLPRGSDKCVCTLPAGQTGRAVVPQQNTGMSTCFCGGWALSLHLILIATAFVIFLQMSTFFPIGRLAGSSQKGSIYKSVQIWLKSLIQWDFIVRNGKCYCQKKVKVHLPDNLRHHSSLYSTNMP